MAHTDTSEKGLEALIVESLVNEAGYQQGESPDYDRDHAVDLAKLTAYLKASQPRAAQALALDQEGPRRTQFLHRLQGEIAKRGIIDVLRHGVKHGPVSLELFYGAPAPGNVERYGANIFSVTRQLRYSKDETQLAPDLCLFINGLPVATFELKNRLTKQTVNDAVQQCKRDREPKELLFQFGRCMVHFAVDDQEVRMCTHLKAKDSWFLPFNQGYNDGAGNPPIESGIKAVQTLSRLNRARPQKTDTFVLDFMNDADTIALAFADYYRTTILSEETDPDKLHDLKATLDGYQVYAWPQVEELVELFLGGADRDKLDPILDACVAVYNSELDEDGQVDFKGKAKAFGRTYQFLASILPYTNADWEKLSIFLNFLVPKLPAPKEEDLSKGLLETIDMDSYRAEVQESLKIALPDQDAEIMPVPTGAGGGKPEPELDRLSNIIKAFNDQFGNIDWKDVDRIRQVISEEIPAKVAADTAYQNAMKNSDKAAARLEHDRALQKVVVGMLADHTELFKQFSDNPSFKKWLADTIFGVTYEGTGA